MEDLICSFWRQYSAFKIAIAKEDLELVARLDLQLDQAIGDIVNRPASDMGEVAHQFRFATDLINVEADDLSCVKHNIELIRRLVEKYVGLGMVPEVSDAFVRQPGTLPYSILDEDRYNDDSEPVVVFKADYTASFANPAFMQLIGRDYSAVLGRHAADLFGFKRFRTDLQIRINDCLNGGVLRFTHAEEIDGETWVKIYELSPCYSPSQSFIGALIRLSVVADRRAARAN